MWIEVKVLINMSLLFKDLDFKRAVRKCCYLRVQEGYALTFVVLACTLNGKLDAKINGVEMLMLMFFRHTLKSSTYLLHQRGVDLFFCEVGGFLPRIGLAETFSTTPFRNRDESKDTSSSSSLIPWLMMNSANSVFHSILAIPL